MIIRCFIVLVLVFKCIYLQAKTIDFDFLVDYMLKNSLTLKNEVLTIQSTQSDLNIFQSELYRFQP